LDYVALKSYQQVQSVYNYWTGNIVPIELENNHNQHPSAKTHTFVHIIVPKVIHKHSTPLNKCDNLHFYFPNSRRCSDIVCCI